MIKQFQLSIALDYIKKSITLAFASNAIEKFFYLSLLNSIIDTYTYQFENSINTNNKLILEIKKFNDQYLKNIALYYSAIVFFYMQQYSNCLDELLKLPDDIHPDKYIYQCICLCLLDKAEDCKALIKEGYNNSSKGKQGTFSRNFYNGIHYFLTKNYQKAIISFKICYKVALKNEA